MSPANNTQHSTTDSDVDSYIAKIRPEFEAALARLVAIPTVSADPAHAQDMRVGAELAAELLREAGMTARIVPTAGHPMVCGELLQDASYPTLTVYNHLDVQPVERSEWNTDPFKLTIEGDKYIGRGATDDKGPALTALMAMRYAIEHQLPLNFKVIWEMEEEHGSEHFEEFIRQEQASLTTDSILVSDSVWVSRDKPAIDVGLRGLMGFEVTITTGRKEAHSGLVGGAARNPIGELAQIIAECYDATTGQILIPGFYDNVVHPTEQELDNFVASGFSVERFMANHGLDAIRTQDVREVLKRIMAEPTFELHGIVGGATDPGIKTVVPPTATAKLSIRLVPNQEPRAVFELVRSFITAHHPDAEVRFILGAPAYTAQLSDTMIEAACAAVKTGFGAEPAFIREGGSIGAVLTMAQYLKAPVLLLGLSLPEQGYHAPNEYFDWGQASGGIKTFVTYFEHIARSGKADDGAAQS